MMQKKSWKQLMLAPMTMIIIALFMSGCSHPLTVKNLNSYSNMGLTSLNKRVTIGIVPSTSDIHCEKLIKSVGEALGRYSADVILPYSAGSSRNVDVLANISLVPDYKGSGWNFLINFPGFLIFAPAWNGYVYNVTYNVNINLARKSDNKQIDAIKIPINLNIRHADFDRTWTEVSWFEVGAIALVGGLVFTQYDTDVSPLLVDAVKTQLGDYIANEIITRLNNSGDFAFIRKTPGPTVFAMAR